MRPSWARFVDIVVAMEAIEGHLTRGYLRDSLVSMRCGCAGSRSVRPSQESIRRSCLLSLAFRGQTSSVFEIISPIALSARTTPSW